MGWRFDIWKVGLQNQDRKMRVVPNVTVGLNFRGSKFAKEKDPIPFSDRIINKHKIYYGKPLMIVSTTQ